MVFTAWARQVLRVYSVFFFQSTLALVDQFAVKALREVEDLDNQNQIKRMNPENLKISDGVILIGIMRSKAETLNLNFQTDAWMPKKVDMVL